VAEEEAIKPILFWTLPGQKIIPGPGKMTVTTSESRTLTKQLRTRTLSNNKVSVSATVSVEAVFGAYSASAEMSTGYESFTENESVSESSETTEISNMIKTEQTIPEGKFGMTIAEMKMYVYKTKDGKKHFVTVPTRKIFTGAVSKKRLKKHILDTSFGSFAQEYRGLKIRTWEEISNLAENIPEVSQSHFPLAERYYAIFNARFPGSRIGVWKPAHFDDIGCGKWSEDGRRPHQDQYWKFVQQPDGTYLLFNKVYRHHRVAASKNTKLRVYDGATFDDQFFNLELIGGNKVRIINNMGSKLQQNSDKHCLFDANIDMEGSDVWELKPESDFN